MRPVWKRSIIIQANYYLRWTMLASIKRLWLFFSRTTGASGICVSQALAWFKVECLRRGIRVPMLVRWPGRITPKSICDEPVIGYDLFPTFAEIVGQPVVNDGLDGSEPFASDFAAERSFGQESVLALPLLSS